MEVKKEIQIKFYCTKDGRCVRGGECKTTNPIHADTSNNKRYGMGIGQEYYICPYLIIERSD